MHDAFNLGGAKAICSMTCSARLQLLGNAPPSISHCAHASTCAFCASWSLSNDSCPNPCTAL